MLSAEALVPMPKGPVDHSAPRISASAVLPLPAALHYVAALPLHPSSQWCCCPPMSLHARPLPHSLHTRPAAVPGRERGASTPKALAHTSGWWHPKRLGPMRSRWAPAPTAQRGSSSRLARRGRRARSRCLRRVSFAAAWEVPICAPLSCGSCTRGKELLPDRAPTAAGWCTAVRVWPVSASSCMLRLMLLSVPPALPAAALRMYLICLSPPYPTCCSRPQAARVPVGHAAAQQAGHLGQR